MYRQHSTQKQVIQVFQQTLIDNTKVTFRFFAHKNFLPITEHYNRTSIVN